MKITAKTIIMLLAALVALPVAAQTTSIPQREMRSAWVATVWRLDWPTTVISSTGNERQIAKQKQEMTTLLDSLALNNFNAINLQVRSRCDALYRSSFEPWSSEIVSERGMDPGWDPLEWVVGECHRRGMECHAWLNPYRYESVAHQWDGTPRNYRDEHPDWLMDVTGSNGTTATILNPGLPEVTQRICDIIAEIVTNYDVDGVLFDDYFYLAGTKTSHDGDLYNAYTANGGTLSIGDWRRDNVNRMISSVYSTIKSIKPWVRFGVSPAGIACTSRSVANSYGIPPCPTGGDWQYNDIYSDPIAWISQQSLDFISPQIYWTIGYSTDYDAATEWWSMVAHKWNRHIYVSHSISELNSASHAPGVSNTEAPMLAPERATGPNSGTFQEYVDEIMLNREYNLDNAPGSIFYSAKYLYRIAPKFSHYLRNHAFTTPCLMPAMPWLSTDIPSPVENVAVNGSTITWQAQPGQVRASVYAYPESMKEFEMVRMPEYLIGVCYGTTFTIPAKYLAGYNFAVATYDRYGNESPLALPGRATQQLAPATLTSPVGGSHVEAPFTLSWQPAPEAAEFIVEIAADAAMTQRLAQASCTGASIESDVFGELPVDQPLYWRVRSCGPGYADGISAVESFTIFRMTIESPAHGSNDVPLTPTFSYSIDDREVTLEIATAENFEQEDIVYTDTHTGSHTVAPYRLAAATTYYARGRHERAGEQLITPVVAFTTAAVEAAAPAVAYPTAGGDLHSDQYITLAPIAGPKTLRIEVCADGKFNIRTSYVSEKVSTVEMTAPVTAGDIKISGKKLVDGQTYYVRARATYNTADGSVNSEYSPAVTFTYRASLSGVDNIAVGGAVSVDGNTVTASADLTNVRVINAAGQTVAFAASMATGASLRIDAPAGVYFMTADGLDAFRFVIQ